MRRVLLLALLDLAASGCKDDCKVPNTGNARDRRATATSMNQIGTKSVGAVNPFTTAGDRDEILIVTTYGCDAGMLRKLRDEWRSWLNDANFHVMRCEDGKAELAPAGCGVAPW